MLLGQAGKIPTTGSNFPFKDLKRTFKDLKLAFKDLKHTFKVFERKNRRAKGNFTWEGRAVYSWLQTDSSPVPGSASP